MSVCLTDWDSAAACADVPNPPVASEYYHTPSRALRCVGWCCCCYRWWDVAQAKYDADADLAELKKMKEQTIQARWECGTITTLPWSLAHSLTHSLADSLTHSLTHSLTR
jgi:hypothetical protein